MSDTPRIPTQFVAPDDVQEQHDRPAGGLLGPAPACGCGPNETCCKCPTERAMAYGALQQDWHDPAPGRDAEAVAVQQAAAAPPPGMAEAIAAGTYAVYDDGHSGYVLVLGTREGETHRKHLPGHLVKMAEKMTGGNSPLNALFGG